MLVNSTPEPSGELSVGDVVHVATESESTWLACKPFTWRRIEAPAPHHGEPLPARRCTSTYATAGAPDDPSGLKGRPRRIDAELARIVPAFGFMKACRSGRTSYDAPSVNRLHRRSAGRPLRTAARRGSSVGVYPIAELFSLHYEFAAEPDTKKC